MYVDPRGPFNSHEVGSSSEWLSGLSNPVSESLHPNISGRAGFATLFSASAGRGRSGSRGRPRYPMIRNTPRIHGWIRQKNV
jgi:hypothetical protein